MVLHLFRHSLRWCQPCQLVQCRLCRTSKLIQLCFFTFILGQRGSYSQAPASVQHQPVLQWDKNSRPGKHGKSPDALPLSLSNLCAVLTSNLCVVLKRLQCSDREIFLLLSTQSTHAVCFGIRAGKASLAQCDQSFAAQHFFPIQKFCPLLCQLYTRVFGGG